MQQARIDNLGFGRGILTHGDGAVVHAPRSLRESGPPQVQVGSSGFDRALPARPLPESILATVGRLLARCVADSDIADDLDPTNGLDRYAPAHPTFLRLALPQTQAESTQPQWKKGTRAVDLVGCRTILRSFP